MTYLKDVYQRFLANPRSASLAADVSLIYVPSTIQIDKPDAVVQHLSRQASIVKKKSEQIISAIEGSDSLCLDIETTLEFIDGGGAYLPSLDDNFLADRVVTIPTVHVVHYNADNQIQQVRLYWDQASLLKEVEVIGARGRNWPIREAKEQTRLIKAAAAAKAAPPQLAPSQDGSRDLPQRPASPGKRHIKDPYAADSLFDLISPSKQDAEPVRPASPGKRHTRDPYAAESLTELLSPSKESSEPVRPYAPSVAKPPQRDLSELFVGDGENEVPDSPSKPPRTGAPKAGAGRANPNRIFGANEPDEDEERSKYKTDPKKFSHFEIGGDNDERELKEEPKRGKSRHQSQWDFDDFVTPQKQQRLVRRDEVRHFDWSDGEGETAETPPARPAVHHPRRDAEVHFEMSEDNQDDDDGRIISSYKNRGQALYQNRLFDENGEAVPSTVEKKHEPLSIVGNAANRKKNFDSHWEMTDDMTEPSKSDAENSKAVPTDRIKAVKMMESSWDNYDQSPEPVRTATHLRNPRRHNQPSWTFGDEE
ncbi:hypothetical protein NUU61_000235 [Penicillium alfredii]|uniref:Uncharacterized protein n=1 Tax=Penicillium alfredii TaxID=1506179 RepID=A0A9W9G999_9EURO|nr:uncharacterized protein NUU61_000235 [Penicillium alfredii]KAJ5114476.1 hypothetical protein NUU61_000235 [Penicillium alfredii]